MRVVIVGNGLAGTIAGKTIRELDSKAEIIILSEERYPYYPRPNLIDFLAGLIPLEKVFAFSESWAERQRLQIRLGQKIIKVEPSKPSVILADDEEIDADYLVLATGARPFLPPVVGLEKRGVFVVRTLDDVLELLGFIQSKPEVIVLGGGLLGLEVARALSLRGLEKITVVEFFNRLLPRQLDEYGAGLLQAQLEKLGIRVFLGREVTEVFGDGFVSGIRFKDGQVVAAGAVIVASGIKPRTELALECGLSCSRGVVVNDYLNTSHPKIYAAGDVAEHRGKIYGLIPAAFDQARILAFNLSGQAKKYEGTIPANTLKVIGLNLTSIGLIAPENGDHEILTREEPEVGVYKKLVLKKDFVVGAIWFGTKKGVQEINRLIQSGKKIGDFKNEILEDNFDFSRIFQE